MPTAEPRKIFEIFSSLLRYPGGELTGTAEQGAAQLQTEHPEAAAALAAFGLLVRQTPDHQLEEVYTAAFDLHPLCTPHVGHHLFGETRERTLFLLRLRQIYREHGHRPGPELPDHLTEIFAFLARNPATPEAEVLIADGLLPALEKMLAPLAETQHPYRPLLQGMRDYLLAAFPAQKEKRKEAIA